MKCVKYCGQLLHRILTSSSQWTKIWKISTTANASKGDFIIDNYKLPQIQKSTFLVPMYFTNWVPKTWFSGFGSAIDKWVLGKLNKDFLHFLPNFLNIFGIIDDFSNWSALKVLKNHQICQKFGQKEKKSCSTCFIPVFWLIPGSRKSDLVSFLTFSLIFF